MLPPPPLSTLFPYTTLFRSASSRRSPSDSAPSTRRRCARSPRRSTASSARTSARIGWASPKSAQSSRYFRSEEHTSELQSHVNLVCRLLLEKKKKKQKKQER